MAIEITDVKIYPFDLSGIGGNVRAYADVIIGGCLMIKGIKVLQSDSGGLFLGYPAVRGKDGKFKDVIVLLDSQTRELIRDCVVGKYKEVLGEK